MNIKDKLKADLKHQHNKPIIGITRVDTSDFVDAIEKAFEIADRNTRALEVAIKFIEYEANTECYVMCGCQTLARKTKEAIQEILLT